MTELEKIVANRYGIITASVLRRCLENGNHRLGATENEKMNMVIGWEQACRRIMGTYAYNESRRARYAVTIKQMEKEEQGGLT